MEYRCRTIPINTVPVGPTGIVCPLCDRCTSKDCSNPIHNVEVSLLGITAKHRAYIRGAEPYFVMVCEGFIL